MLNILLWRTTDDMPSMGAGFNKNLKIGLLKMYILLKKHIIC